MMECNKPKIKSILIFDRSDLVFTKNSVRLKRRYGKFDRKGYKIECNGKD